MGFLIGLIVAVWPAIFGLIDTIAWFLTDSAWLINWTDGKVFFSMLWVTFVGMLLASAAS